MPVGMFWRRFMLCFESGVQRKLASSVPPKYSNLSVIIELDQILSAPLLCLAGLVHGAGYPCFAVPNLRSTPAGEPRLTTTTRCAASFRSETGEADARRSPLLGLAAVRVDRLEIRSDHCQSRDGRCLAPEGLPLVLEVEDTPWPARPAPSATRGAGSDSDHESE